jgi:GrpB-like predicted nucleotidyltransferase (UPF0157 family)
VTETEYLERALHEDISLHPYDPKWPALFLAERASLIKRFPTQLLDIQHFGSTAIPGMAAKPVIDLLAGVESMAVADTLLESLVKAGYFTPADFNATLDDRRWLMRWSEGRRTHHLHLVVFGGATWQGYIRFRDALLAHPNLVERYAQLKHELALQYSSDREAYTEGKTGFVLSVLRNA